MHGRHVPSENTLDGQHAPMEAHLVHQIALPEYVGSNAHLAVRRGTPLLLMPHHTHSSPSPGPSRAPYLSPCPYPYPYP